MSTPPALTFKGSARIGGQALFEPVDLHVPAGRWTCLLGASGVGKTTLLRLIAGIEETAQLDGRITASDGLPLPRRIALMAQSDLLMPWLDATENTLLGARLRGTPPDHARARDVLDRVGLSDHAHKRPGQLSGGQRQRVALARTLMEDRAIVLLDEPFSALDARTRSQMQDLACDLLAGRTVLMVTHDPAEAARVGDAILIMAPDRLTPVPPPPSAPPRAIDDPATLQAQADLLTRLRDSAA